LNVSVSFNLGPDDAPPGMTPAEVLTMLGGDPAKDTCSMTVNANHQPPTQPAPLGAPPR
jgi:hypothetical protein